VTEIACPQCGSLKSKVTKVSSLGDRIRRRRECVDCGHKFSTVEVIVPTNAHTHKLPKLADFGEGELVGRLHPVSEEIKGWISAYLLEQSKAMIASIKEIVADAVAREPARRGNIAVPDWVPQLYHGLYRDVAKRYGEELAAAHIRRIKNGELK
jgi:hypothetical protein